MHILRHLADLLCPRSINHRLKIKDLIPSEHNREDIKVSDRVEEEEGYPKKATWPLQAEDSPAIAKTIGSTAVKRSDQEIIRLFFKCAGN